MKNNIRLTVQLFVLLFTVFSSNSYATLVGDTVQGSVNGVGFNWPSNTAVVGAGVEFSAVLTNATILADFTADTITLSYENTSIFPNITAAAGSFVFSDLDWLGVPQTIIGLTELSNSFPGAALFTTAFTADSFQINVPLTNTNPTDLFEVTYRIETAASSVAEPATLALLGIGLAGLGFCRRIKA